MGKQFVKTIKMRAALLLALSIVCAFAAPAGTWAATAAKTTAPTVNNSANTLKISPLRTDIAVEAGSSAVVKTYVTNLTDTAIQLKPIENDFVAGDEKGTPSLILDENSYAPTHSLKRFMVPISNITVPANSTKPVEVTIKIPKSAQAGGYFGAIRFAPAGSTSDKNVNLSSSVASLILLTVPGALVDKLTLTNFDVQQNGGTASNFRSPNDISLLVRFKNEGNVQETPFGQVYVQKGKKTLYTYNFNEKSPREAILPDSARRWLVPIKGMGKFGKYTVMATFGYGSKGETIQISKTVWIVPTAIIMAIVIAIVVIALIVLGGWVFLRNYKRRIMKSSRRRY